MSKWESIDLKDIDPRELKHKKDWLMVGRRLGLKAFGDADARIIRTAVTGALDIYKKRASDIQLRRSASASSMMSLNEDPYNPYSDIFSHDDEDEDIFGGGSREQVSQSRKRLRSSPGNEDHGVTFATPKGGIERLEVTVSALAAWISNASAKKKGAGMPVLEEILQDL